MTGAWLAVQFLTRLPLPALPDVENEELAQASRYYPLAGAFIALAALAGLGLGAWLWAPGVGAAAAVLAMLVLAGGLHARGLSGCIDAMLVQGDKEKKLQVLHDTRAGALGAAGVATWKILQVALILACIDRGTAAAGLWLAPIVARAVLPWELAKTPAATPGKGMFGRICAHVTDVDVTVAGVLAAALALPFCFPVGEMLPRLALGLLLAGAATYAWRAYWVRQLGGINGDVLGGAVEIREVAVMAAMGADLALFGLGGPSPLAGY
jgi:adenosylcobinamide-GDP ribazoletransferase